MASAFTKTRLLMGINFEKTIALNSYGGAEIKVHAVPDAELAEVQSRLNYGIFDAIRDMSNMGLEDAEIGALADNQASPDALKKLAGLSIPATLFNYMIALCEKGIIPVADPECPECHGKPVAICPACDIRKDIKSLVGFSTFEIGAVVLGMSVPNWQEVEDFFNRRKAASGQESSPSPA